MRPRAIFMVALAQILLIFLRAVAHGLDLLLGRLAVLRVAGFDTEAGGDGGNHGDQKYSRRHVISDSIAHFDFPNNSLPISSRRISLVPAPIS